MQWDATSHHRDALKYIDAFLDEKRPLLQIFYVWGHSYEFNRDNNWDLIENICSKTSPMWNKYEKDDLNLCKIHIVFKVVLVSKPRKREYLKSSLPLHIHCCCLVAQSCPTFVIPWTVAHQASLSFSVSQSLLKLMSTASMMPPNRLILCDPPFLLLSIFSSIKVFSNGSTLCIR